MNRLTSKTLFTPTTHHSIRYEEAFAVNLSKSCNYEIVERDSGHHFLAGVAANKLAAYEDIGLDPDELKELVKKHVPKPAIVTKDHYMERSLTGVRRHTVVRYRCPECEAHILDHHITETLDQYTGYNMNAAIVEPGDRRCSCGQLVSVGKEENKNG